MHHRDAWKERQQALQSAARECGLTSDLTSDSRPPLADGPELLSLAYEIMADDRFLSLDQALDAAAAMQSELLDVRDWWLIKCVRKELELVKYADDWDYWAGWEYAIHTPREADDAQA